MRFTSMVGAILFCALAPAIVAQNLAVYLPDYRCTSTDANYTFYDTTHLILFSAKPNEDGSLDHSRLTPELLAAGKKAKAQNPKVKIQFCVGGWGRGKLFAQVVSDADRRERLVKAISQLNKQHQLDGVDIDWEFPKGAIEHQNFALFLQSLAEKLRPQNQLVTIALSPAHPLQRETYQWIDQINLMSYQPWNPVESYEDWLEKSLLGFLESGAPPEKVNIGLPFFSKELGGERRAIMWNIIAQSDSLPESEYPFSPVGKGVCDLRIHLMEKHQLGGVMVWEYGQDIFQPANSLLNHLSKSLDR